MKNNILYEGNTYLEHRTFNPNLLFIETLEHKMMFRAFVGFCNKIYGFKITQDWIIIIL